MEGSSSSRRLDVLFRGEINSLLVKLTVQVSVKCLWLKKLTNIYGIYVQPLVS